MTRRLFLLAVTIAVVSAALPAATTYRFTLNTPGFVGQSGYIDLSYNPSVNGSASPSAVVSNIMSAGYTFAPGQDLTSGPNVTGSRLAPPISIAVDPNAAVNFYDLAVNSFGTSLSFDVMLSGAIANTAFRLTLYNSNFSAFLASPLGDSEVANLTVNANGAVSSQGSTFTGGSAGVAESGSSTVPEPSTFAVGTLALLAGVVLRKRILSETPAV